MSTVCVQYFAISAKRHPNTCVTMIMRPSVILWCTLVGLSVAVANTPADPAAANGITGTTTHHNQPPAQSQGQPGYSGQPQDPMANYVGAYSPPAVAYGGYEAGYGVQNPSLYDYMMASNYPTVKTEPSTPDPVFVLNSVMPTFKVLGVAVRAVAKLGFMVFAGLGILSVGVLFTTVVCSLTPFCTITFLNGYGVSQETVRSLLTPDKITATAEFVQQALDKYQRIQNSVR